MNMNLKRVLFSFAIGTSVTTLFADKLSESNFPSYVDTNHFGFCLRASRDLEKGTHVATADLIMTDKPFNANHSSPEFTHVALMAISLDGTPIYGKVQGKWAYCNHSCEPNCDLTQTWEVITNTNVCAHEELTTAYDAYIPHVPWQDNWTFTCQCNAKNCKKVIDKYRYDIAYPASPAIQANIHSR